MKMFYKFVFNLTVTNLYYTQPQIYWEICIMNPKVHKIVAFQKHTYIMLYYTEHHAQKMGYMTIQTLHTQAKISLFQVQETKNSSN